MWQALASAKNPEASGLARRRAAPRRRRTERAWWFVRCLRVFKCRTLPLYGARPSTLEHKQRAERATAVQHEVQRTLTIGQAALAQNARFRFRAV